MSQPVSDQATPSNGGPRRGLGLPAAPSVAALLATIFTALVACHGAVVHGDPAFTARHLLTSATLYKIGFAANLIVLACALPL